MTRHTKNKKSNRSGLWRPLPMSLLLVGCLVLIICTLEVTNTTHFFHKAVAKTAIIASTSPKVSSSTTSTPPTTPAGTSTSGASGGSGSSGPAKPVIPDTGAATKGAGDAAPAAPNTSSTPPTTPYGTFISNHHPNLSGSPAPSKEESVCTTTPGATCSIKFTNGDLTRTLAAQTTDYDGSAYWTWDVKQSGFTQGTWAVTVTATLNGQTATAQDTLKVGP